MPRAAQIMLGIAALIGWLTVTVAMILRPLPPGPF